jgi:hypothetical protein
MRNYLTFSTNIGASKYKLKIKKLGGMAFLYRNDELVTFGQWFPDQEYLRLDRFNFEDIRSKLEDVVKKEHPQVVFPYFEKSANA